jgi:hypothetical protein
MHLKINVLIYICVRFKSIFIAFFENFLSLTVILFNFFYCFCAKQITTTSIDFYIITIDFT